MSIAHKEPRNHDISTSNVKRSGSPRFVICESSQNMEVAELAHEHSNMGASISRITQKMTQVTPHMETRRKGPLIEFVGVGVGGPLSKFGGEELGL